MNRNIEGIINTGSGDQDFEIRRTREEFTSVAEALQRVRTRHAQRLQESRVQSGIEIREAIRIYVYSVRGELSQSFLFPIRIDEASFDFDTTNWTIEFHGANRAINADSNFLADRVWFQHGEHIIRRIGETLMSLRAHTNAL